MDRKSRFETRLLTTNYLRFRLLQPANLVILLILFSASNSFSQTRINLTDFGLTKNSPSNASTAIQAAIKACSRKTNAILVLPGGRIDVWPEGSFQRELYISNCTEDDTLSKEKHIAFLFD